MSRVALILVEGETEEEFYTLLLEKYHRRHPRQIKNLHGNFSIDKKILDAAVKYANDHPGREFDVYVCLDQERIGTPPYHHAACEAKLREYTGFNRLIPVIAVLMCESLFFLDIEGIYKFLRAPRTQRKPHHFKNHRQLTHVHLSKLFKAHDKIYRKGRRCQNFVAHLDLEKMLKAREIAHLLKSLGETAS